MPGHPHPSWLAVLIAVLWAGWASPAAAQIDGVSLRIDREHIGLAGSVRIGTWTPMRLALVSHSPRTREVICRWLLRDADGDQVVSERRATLNPGREEFVWLFAVPAVNGGLNSPWTVQVVDGETQRLLASSEVTANPTLVLPTSEAAIGLIGGSSLGLEPYAERYTQHEAVRTLRGLAPGTLPDRWYGLSLIETLIWAPTGSETDEPTSPTLTPAIEQAVREWVRRGGHLVIMLPAIGQTWTASGLADLLPVTADQMQRVEGEPPRWLFDLLPGEPFEIQMTAFDVDAEDGLAVLLRDRTGRAMVVAGRYGFGRVTVMGVNLADPRLAAMGLPNGVYRVWNTIFDWQSPVLSKQYVEGEIHARRMSRPAHREEVELGRFLPSQIAMRNTAGPMLLIAVGTFLLYWVLAGPAGFYLLKRRGEVRHSWLAFVAVVLVFSALSWGGAGLLRPGETSVAHFSVVDVDGRTGLVHTRSWLSLFVPTFGRASVVLDPEGDARRHTLSSAGLVVGGAESGGFLDPQPYAIDASSPHAAAIPVRATAKQFELDYLGPLNADTVGLTDVWTMPQGEVRIDARTFWPTGRLVHRLPGTLRNVLVVYCPGRDAREPDGTPWVWRHGSWAPDDVLEIDRPTTNLYRLVQRPGQYSQDRDWEREGFLGQLIGHKTGHRFADLDPLQIAAADSDISQAVEMLTFYSALPPPNFRLTDFTRLAAMYQRSLGRSLDLTPLTAGRRLIVIGYLERAPLPAPLTVDGEPVPATGWTVVRWVYDLE